MSTIPENVALHIKADGQYRIQVVGGYSLAGDGGEVIGIRVSTKGRVKPLDRWHREFVLWGNPDDTARSLHAKWDAWLAEARS